jgi:hypothetical protein
MRKQVSTYLPDIYAIVAGVERDLYPLMHVESQSADMVPRIDWRWNLEEKC